MEKFKVKELIEVCGDAYINIVDFNKVTANGSNITHWEGYTDDYFKERPFGDYDVMHIYPDNTAKGITLIILIELLG